MVEERRKEQEAPTLSQWEKDLKAAENRLADAVEGIWEEEFFDAVTGYEPEFGEGETEEVAKETAKGLRAALTTAKTSVGKFFQGIKDSFNKTVDDIKTFIKADRPKKAEYIKAKCDYLFKKTKVQAQKAGRAIAEKARATGRGIRDAAKAVIGAPGKVVRAIKGHLDRLKAKRAARKGGQEQSPV